MNIEKFVTEYIQTHGVVSEHDALTKNLAGLVMFDTPIFAYADAEDSLFCDYANIPEITHNKFIPPKQWLSDALSVISIFFPFSDKVKASNSKDMDMPSTEWLHARIEGQKVISECTQALEKYIKSEGYSAHAPGQDAGRRKVYIGDNEHRENKYFSSNWSERHVAYAAGLGTFSLSKGVITAKGVAGRFSSIITNYPFEIAKREYTDIYEYCNMCGKCIENCPVNAISQQDGKMHYPCKVFLDKVYDIYEPRYGCGKCQVGVPCMSEISKKITQ